MRTRRRAHASIGIAAALVVASAASALPQTPVIAPPPAFAAMLTSALPFSAADVASLGRGAVVVKSLQAGESREVPVVGMLWFDVPVAYFLTRARDIVGFKKVEEVKQIGVFGPRATPADLGALTLEEQDVKDLRRCAVGECKVKLDAAGLERFRKEVVWTAPDAALQANRIARELLAGYAAAYQKSGNAALIEYHDRERATRLADGIRALLDRSPWMRTAAPGLREYVEAFPAAPSPHAEDFLYWSKEAFGMKPTVSATHTTLWRGPGGAADAAILAKQIYASHYLEASISLTLLASDTRPAQPGVIVVYMNRSLVDLLQGGLFGPFQRSIARSRTRGGLEDHLRALRKRIEADYKALPPKAGLTPPVTRPQ